MTISDIVEGLEKEQRDSVGGMALTARDAANVCRLAMELARHVQGLQGTFLMDPRQKHEGSQ